LSDLLDLAIEAHGGLALWRAAHSLKLTLSMSGNLLRIKGHPRGLEGVEMLVHTQRPEVRIEPFAETGQIGHFNPALVWIDSQKGQEVQRLNDPRTSFVGHVRTTPWTQLQWLYFTGYALWNYLTTPFLFTEPGFHVEETLPHHENEEVWRTLRVKYPPNVPTHCAEQLLYFSQSGLLQRVDYVTDIAGGIASHYCYDHQVFDGLTFPTLRRVVARSGNQSKLSGPTAVLLQLSKITVE